MCYLGGIGNHVKTNSKLRTKEIMRGLTIALTTAFPSVCDLFCRLPKCPKTRLLAIDMNTLARMTGKDFSGPVPEIRVPPQSIPVVAPSQEDINSQTDVTPRQHAKKRSRSKSQFGVETGVIVVGDADTFQN